MGVRRCERPIRNYPPIGHSNLTLGIYYIVSSLLGLYDVPGILSNSKQRISSVVSRRVIHVLLTACIATAREERPYATPSHVIKAALYATMPESLHSLPHTYRDLRMCPSW